MEIGLGPALTPRAHSFPFSLVIPFVTTHEQKRGEENANADEQER